MNVEAYVLLAEMRISILDVNALSIAVGLEKSVTMDHLGAYQHRLNIGLTWPDYSPASTIEQDQVNQPDLTSL